MNSTRVHASFGKLRKLKMQFSMPWNILEKEVFQNGHGKFFLFVFGKILKYAEIDIA